MVYLSVNGAKLVALILNALYGILQYADEFGAEHKSADIAFALRVVQGEVGRIADHCTTRDYPSDLLQQLRNISAAADRAASELQGAVREDAPLQYDKLRRLLSAPYAFTNTAYRRTEPRLVWKQRTTFSSNLTDEQSERCISELFSEDGNCRPSRDCMEAMLGTKYLTNYALSRQAIYYTLAARNKLCRRSLLSFYGQDRKKFGEHLNELCTNILHEMEIFLSRVAPDLDRLTPLQKDLLMQHVFVCGQHGFVEVARPRLLWMTLRQQRVSDGCFPLSSGHSLPDIGRHLLAAVPTSEDCSAHSASVATGALCVFLGFILTPSHWADFHLVDAAFSLASAHSSTPTEGHFAQLEWQKWTDRAETGGLPLLGDPPALEHHIRADFIAFLLLLCGIVCFISLSQYYCGRGGKQFYGYAYKKL